MSDTFAPPPAPRADGTPAPVTPPPDSAAGHDPAPRRTPGTPKGRDARTRVPGWVRVFLVVAAAAIVAGLAWSLAIAIADAQAAPADPKATGPLHALQVVEGMCLESLGQDGTVADAEVVRCREPHRAEVIATMTYPLEVFPGEESLREQGLDFCADRVRGMIPANGAWVAWLPSSDSWTRGDRTALCLVTSEEPTEGSVIPAEPFDGETA